jgi:RND family efflux transporter MFP subunit
MRKQLLTALVASMLAMACGRSDSPSASPTPLVRAHTVAPAAGAALELRGSVVAAHRVHLGFKQGGVVAAVLVDEGDRIAGGQLVARLDDVDARSFVRAALAGRDKARRDAERAQRLSQQGALPTSTRDDALSQLEAAEAQLAQAEDALERTRLRAPVSGTIFKRLSEAGETVGGGNPVLIIDSSDRLVVRAGATEGERARLTVGLPVSVVLDDGRTLDGRLSSLATTPDLQDGLYAVEVAPGASKPPLLSGTLVRLRFAGSKQATQVRLPLEALIHRQGQDYVFVLEKGSPARARLRAVDVSHVDGTDIVVRSGLSQGERVVAEGGYFLQDEQPVRIFE